MSVMIDVRNIHVFCLDAVYCRRSLRGAWKMRSPRRAACRLYSGLSTFAFPVSNGEPCVTSAG